MSFRMSGFHTVCLNGSFAGSSNGLTKQGREPFQIVCRCTDRFSSDRPKRPDRWHLEVDGQVKAYRMGTDLGSTTGAWYEWLHESWTASPGAENCSEQPISVAGFSEHLLNGIYMPSLAYGFSHLRWIKTDETGKHDVSLRFTNRSSHLLELPERPFDRWHLEIKGECRAYLCSRDPSGVGWKEATVSPTDQMIRNSFAASLPLYVGSCERVGKFIDESHYAATNHKEYFAECSEAYFSTHRFRNDYFPYIAAELKAYDPVAFAMCQSFWGPRAHEEAMDVRYLKEFSPNCRPDALTLSSSSEGYRRLLARVEQEAGRRRELKLAPLEGKSIVSCCSIRAVEANGAAEAIDDHHHGG